MAFFGLTRDFPTHPIIWVIDRNYVSRCLRPSSCFPSLVHRKYEIQTLLHGSKGIGWQCWLCRYLFFGGIQYVYIEVVVYRMPLAAGSSRDRCWMDQKVWSSLSSAVLYALCRGEMPPLKQPPTSPAMQRGSKVFPSSQEKNIFQSKYYFWDASFCHS